MTTRLRPPAARALARRVAGTTSRRYSGPGATNPGENGTILTRRPQLDVDLDSFPVGYRRLLSMEGGHILDSNLFDRTSSVYMKSNGLLYNNTVYNPGGGQAGGQSPFDFEYMFHNYRMCTQTAMVNYGSMSAKYFIGNYMQFWAPEGVRYIETGSFNYSFRTFGSFLVNRWFNTSVLEDETNGRPAQYVRNAVFADNTYDVKNGDLAVFRVDAQSSRAVGEGALYSGKDDKWFRNPQLYTFPRGCVFRGNTVYTRDAGSEPELINFGYESFIEDNSWSGNVFNRATPGKLYKKQTSTFPDARWLLWAEKENTQTDISLESIGFRQASDSRFRIDQFDIVRYLDKEASDAMSLDNIDYLPLDASGLARGEVKMIADPTELSELRPGWQHLDLRDFGDTHKLSRPLDYEDVGPAWMKGGKLRDAAQPIRLRALRAKKTRVLLKHDVINFKVCMGNIINGEQYLEWHQSIGEHVSKKVAEEGIGAYFWNIYYFTNGGMTPGIVEGEYIRRFDEAEDEQAKREITQRLVAYNLSQQARKKRVFESLTERDKARVLEYAYDLLKNKTLVHSGDGVDTFNTYSFKGTGRYFFRRSKDGEVEEKVHTRHKSGR